MAYELAAANPLFVSEAVVDGHSGPLPIRQASRYEEVHTICNRFQIPNSGPLGIGNSLNILLYKSRRVYQLTN